MADNLSDALLSLILAQGRRLSEILLPLATEGLAQDVDLEIFRALARFLVCQHTSPFPESLRRISSEPPSFHNSRVRIKKYLSMEDQYRFSLLQMLTAREGVLTSLDRLFVESTIVDLQNLQAMERRFLAWRWKLRGRSERLRQVYGRLQFDQIIVLPQGEITLIDPGLEPGDPALDVSIVTVALIELGAQEPLCWMDGYRLLLEAFWSTYLAASGDHELLDVTPPFLAWRALQCCLGATPGVQRRLLAFAEEVLEQSSFNPDALRWISR